MASPDEIAFTRAVGARIAEARDRAGITNASAFGRMIGVTPNTVYRYEKGDILPSFYVLEQVARSLAVSLDWLATGRMREAPEPPASFAAWLATPVGQAASPAAVEYLRELPLEVGDEPDAVFYGLAFLAFQRGLTRAEAVTTARLTRAARDL